MSGVIIILGQASDPVRGKPAHQAALKGVSLLATVAIGVVVVGVVLLLVLRNQRRALFVKGKKRKARPDAWEESGRRLHVEGREGEAGPDDGTVDIDPEDLPGGGERGGGA